MSSKISGVVEKKSGEECEARLRGRPRCPVTHRNILSAVREMVDESGVGGLTIEGVAARAGVGKTTIYRRWPDKSSLVLDAFFEEDAPRPAFPETGDIRADVRRHLRRLVRDLNGPLGCRLAALLGSSQFDEEMAEAFRRRWIEPRRSEARAVIERAIERGEIDREIDPDVLIDALYGPVYFRLLGEHAPLSQGFADAVVELVLGGRREGEE